MFSDQIIQFLGNSAGEPTLLYFGDEHMTDLEKYETHIRGVRQWLNDVVGFFAAPSTQYPVLVHCTSGKDRTGVVVAALLLIVGINRDLIVGEYLLSDGDVNQEWIEMAIDGIRNVDSYFKRVDLHAVRTRFAM